MKSSKSKRKALHQDLTNSVQQDRLRKAGIFQKGPGEFGGQQIEQQLAACHCAKGGQPQPYSTTKAVVRRSRVVTIYFYLAFMKLHLENCVWFLGSPLQR